MANTALESFVTQFAAGAGTLLRWHVTSSGCLRAWGTPSRVFDPWDGPVQKSTPLRLCPLSAQYTLDTGQSADAETGWLAAERHYGLPRVVVNCLMDAADGRAAPADMALRARLLRICLMAA